MPRAPSVLIARSASRTAASGLLAGMDAVNAGNQCGYCRQTAANSSFAIFASSGERFSPASNSMGGLDSESTCWKSPNCSISFSRASMSQRAGSAAKALRPGLSGAIDLNSAYTLAGVKWLNMSITLMSLLRLFFSGEFSLIDFLERASLGLDADQPQGDRRDQEGEGEGVKNIVAEAMLEHEADDGWCKERADA